MFQNQSETIVTDVRFNNTVMNNQETLAKKKDSPISLW